MQDVITDHQEVALFINEENAKDFEMLPITFVYCTRL